MQKIVQKITDIAALWRKTTALLCGVLLALALPPFFQFWAVFVAFSGAIWLCVQAGDNKKNLTAIGYWFGFGFFACGFYWIGNALLVDAAATGFLYPVVLLLNGAFFGLFTILPFWATAAGKNTLSKLLWFTAVWFLSTEWLRSFLLTGFPWNPISSVLAFRPALLQTLAFIGTYGLSMVVIFFAALPVFWLIKPTKKRLILPIIAVGFFGILWEYGTYIIAGADHFPDGESVMVRLVQPNIPQTLKWNKQVADANFQDYINLSLAKDNHHIDFVLWGETASPFDLTADNAHRQRIRAAVPRHGYLITGLLRRQFEFDKFVPYNSLAVLNKKGQVLNLYDKSHLVPFGEYIPWRNYFPQWVRPLTNNVAEFGRGEQFKTITIDGYPEFAPLICYEVIFSDDVVRKVNKPQWMIVLTNDGWYGNSAGPHQHLVAAQMRAVEEGMTVVRSANSGISAVITPYGQIPAKIGLGKRGIKDAAVKLNLAHDTLFGQYGNAIPLGMAAAMIFLAWLISQVERFKAKRQAKSVLSAEKTNAEISPAKTEKKRKSVQVHQSKVKITKKAKSTAKTKRKPKAKSVS